MADSMMYYVVQNLAQLLKNEASILGGGRVGQDIKSLYDGLVQIKKFLHNSEGKRVMIKDLLRRIQNVVEEVDDVIDMFATDVAKHKKRSTRNFQIENNTTTMLRGVGIDIKVVLDEIKKIYSMRDRYGIGDQQVNDNGDGDLMRIQCAPKTEFEESDNYSKASLEDEMLEQLLTAGGNCLHIVSVVGMPGVGKTSFILNIYNNKFVKKRFDFRAWVCISQEYRYRDVLLSILHGVSTPSTTEEINKMNDEDLGREVSEFLEDRRYLIVLDDIWSTSVWDKLRSNFPDMVNSSRILITTRHFKVGITASSNPPFQLRPLTEDESWEYFSRARVFQNREMELYGKMIARAVRYVGVPSTVLLVADLLAKQDWTLETWSEIAHTTAGFEGTLNILKLVCEKLPSYLKPCFLYFGVFPEEYEIPAAKLVWLWVMEGFVMEEDDNGDSSSTRRKKLEDVAEGYLEELVNRKIVKVVARRSGGGIKSCSMHYLLHQTCIAEGVEENFMAQRRLSVHVNASEYISSPPFSTLRVRTLLCFDNKDVLSVEKLNGFRLLKVLDFGNTVVHKIPLEIEQFIHLRYLRMNAPLLREIPLCISSLPKLETLDLRESGIVNFRDNFWKMQQLIHLFILGDCDLLNDRAKQVKIMPNLRTLSTISPQLINALDFKTVFPSVRKLGLMSSRYVIGSRIPNLTNIETLKIIDPFYFRFHPDSFSRSLTKVTLLRTEVSQRVLATLGKLPNLRVLKLLKKSLAVWHMECSEESFPELRVLHMAELDVSKWTLETGAMSKLVYLVIRECAELMEAPKNLKRISTLRLVNTSWCSSKLEKNLRDTLPVETRYKFQATTESESGFQKESGRQGLNTFSFGR